MQVMIDIDDHEYTEIKEDAKKFRSKGMAVPYLYKIIVSGTPLPKGHGDLKDVSKFIYDCDYGVCDKICRCDNCVHHIVREQVIKDAPTIIEADKEEQYE